jgi:hypothetical protein
VAVGAPDNGTEIAVLPSQQNLTRFSPRQLIEQTLGGRTRSRPEIARGHVGEGQAEAIARLARHRGNIVRRTRLQRFLVENHPWRDHADYAALDHALGQLGIFKLLA